MILTGKWIQNGKQESLEPYLLALLAYRKEHDEEGISFSAESLTEGRMRLVVDGELESIQAWIKEVEQFPGHEEERDGNAIVSWEGSKKRMKGLKKYLLEEKQNHPNWKLDINNSWKKTKICLEIPFSEEGSVLEEAGRLFWGREEES